MTPVAPVTAQSGSLLEKGLALAPQVPAVPTPAPPPEAVLLPPILASLAAASIVGSFESTFFAGGDLVAVLRGAALTLLLIVPCGLITLWARANDSRVGLAVASAVALVLGITFATVTSSLAVHLATLVVAVVFSIAAPFAWRRWQALWTERRIERFSVLAATALGAHEAIRRLETVPWVRVVSVLVPEGDAELSSRLLHRPVAKGARGGPRLERRVIVSSPVRDPSVGRSIAELVARGHDLTSESATLRTAEGRVDSLRADPLNLLMGRPSSRIGDAASRALDIVLSLFLILVASPILLGAAVAIVINDGFPILYRQKRVGAGGRLFHVLKFRSMRKDAEKASGPVWASEGDPRITRVGRFLRRYRIDELPQLFNVLAGQMALVGPRPERPHFFDVLRATVPLFELRTIVRPGLTGWAQVRLAYGASSDDARQKLEYDLYYVTRRSPWFDLAILAETARVVLTGAGAR